MLTQDLNKTEICISTIEPKNRTASPLFPLGKNSLTLTRNGVDF